MNIIKTEFPEILIIEPDLFNDSRGFFLEAYNYDKFTELGFDYQFIQDNHSMSLKVGTIRGMHFQLAPFAQTKLIRVIRGAIINYVVDIRLGSPNYQKHLAITLSDEKKQLLLIPKGFANGMETLTDKTELLYKVDQPYAPKFDRSFSYSDREIGINWQTTTPVLSKRDTQAPLYKDCENNFVFGKNS